MNNGAPPPPRPPVNNRPKLVPAIGVVTCSDPGPTLVHQVQCPEFVFTRTYLFRKSLYARNGRAAPSPHRVVFGTRAPRIPDRERLSLDLSNAPRNNLKLPAMGERVDSMPPRVCACVCVCSGNELEIRRRRCGSSDG